MTIFINTIATHAVDSITATLFSKRGKGCLKKCVIVRLENLYFDAKVTVFPLQNKSLSFFTTKNTAQNQ
jgi:hypothetical protein